MYFKPYYLGCLAHASYLIGGDNGEAAVIDPRRDVEEYIADAAAAGLRIRHVIETHLHADFVSGHAELAERCAASIHIGARAGASFTHEPVRDGDEIGLGDVVLRFLETPGHTPESVTVTATVAGSAEPSMAFTGDTLFIGDVGRPDLAGGQGLSPDEMARTLYHSLRDRVLTLPDSTQVWPAHGAGSSCGRALSEDRDSTIGRERATNPALQYVVAGDTAGFVEYATHGLPQVPAYFSHDVQQNRAGGASIQSLLAHARPLSAADLMALPPETIILDVRSVSSFGLGHVPGSVHVQLDGKFAPWVGMVAPPEAALAVVADAGREDEAITRLARIGYERIEGWLEGGFDSWQAAGGEIARVDQIDPSGLLGSPPHVPHATLLDVRSAAEWSEGHLEGAMHIPLPELADRLQEVPRGPVIVICGSGYRSSIACSLLQRAGRSQISNAAGGMAAIQELRISAVTA